MEKFRKNKPVKLEKYMYEFAQEMGLSLKRKQTEEIYNEKAKGTS